MAVVILGTVHIRVLLNALRDHEGRCPLVAETRQRLENELDNARRLSAYYREQQRDPAS